ncbi:MlaD family protein [Cellvibrio sp. QJXJ]|uniref:MlaD family protein n=1 Tax=Cellvibrio sp. QJXJ TaxID=2964606 RepID=UPI0021C452B7|nr:MlaD family protein [Cellvibrio sp. QJXJ]UUA74034.1 MlaD family protein [Cellvibrio sp. QJXJ]
MKKNNSFRIGAFIVGAILLVFLALLFFSGGDLFSQKERVVMYFEGSVQGLQVGAPIKLKGVILGEITDIQINFDSNTQDNGNKNNSAKNIVTTVTGDLALKRISRKGNEVSLEFFEEAIANGLRAQLNFQSFLTGLLYVELDFFPDTPATLYGFKKNYLELPTVATGFEELTKNLQEINLKSLVKNLDQLTLRLNNIVKSGVIEETLGSVKLAADSFTETSQTMGQDVSQLSKNLSDTSRTLNTLLASLNKQTPAVADELRASMLQLQRSLVELDKASNSVHQSFSEDAPLVNQLNDTLKEISRSAEAFRTLSETIDQQPEALLRGKQVSDEDE